MAALHIRNVDDAVVEALKRRAAANHRSLEGELRLVVEEAAFGPSRKRPARRKLELHTVSVGSKSKYSRDEIYGEDER